MAVNAPAQTLRVRGPAPTGGPEVPAVEARSTAARMNSGLGVAAGPAVEFLASALPPDADGRFTAGEALRNVLRGMGNVFVETWNEFKAHPIRQTATLVGMAALSALLPIVGTVVMAFELGQAALKMGAGLLKMAGLLRADQPDDAERALGNVGEGLSEVGLVAIESWLENVVDINRAIPKTVVATFRRLRSAIARLFGGGKDVDPD